MTLILKRLQEIASAGAFFIKTSYFLIDFCKTVDYIFVNKDIRESVVVAMLHFCFYYNN